MIERIDEFAKNGDKSISGLTLTTGFPRQQKPYRQWMNYLFNLFSVKTNEVVDEINKISENVKPLFEPIHVGEIFVTTNDYATAAQVRERHGYGTWVRYAEGRTLVGYSSKSTDMDDYRIMGNMFGEDEHKLSLTEMPLHKHSLDPYNKFAAKASETTSNTTAISFDRVNIENELAIGGFVADDWTLAKEKVIGGQDAHNNIQPSIVVGYWLRTE